MDTDNPKNTSDDQLGLIARTVVQNQHEITELTQTVDKIAHTVVQNQSDISELNNVVAKKNDVDNLSSTLDEILVLVKKKDQELTFINERVKRVENDVEKIQPLVGLV